MSFILEALRKSESDRQRLGSVALADLPVARRRSGQPWWVFALGAFLLIDLLLLVAVLMRDKTPPVPDSNSSVITTPSNITRANTRASPPPQPLPTPVVPGINNSLQGATAQVHYEPVPTSELEIANAAASMPDGQTLVRPSGTFNSDPGRIDTGTSSSPNVARPETRSSSELHLDLHVYSSNPRERFVLINMRRYAEGQQLPNGGTVEQITPQGVVVHQNGARYQIDRQ